jgi:hypothetical protein
MKEGGPWNFRGNPILIEEYDGLTKPSEIELFFIDIWIQIHELPVGFAPMIKSLASKIGKFIHSEGVSNDFEANFYRVRVKLDVRKPLRVFVTMVSVISQRLRIEIERKSMCALHSCIENPGDFYALK